MSEYELEKEIFKARHDLETHVLKCCICRPHPNPWLCGRGLRHNIVLEDLENALKKVLALKPEVNISKEIRIPFLRNIKHD